MTQEESTSESDSLLIWLKPSAEDTFKPSTVGKDHKAWQSHARPIKTETILTLGTTIYTLTF